MATIDTQLNPLIEEAQLGQRLNESVHAANSSDFSLLLAMLVDDVRAHSQFQLPHEESVVANVDDETLRNNFSLPAKTSLSLTSLAQINAYSQADIVEKGLLASLQLANIIHEKPIAFRDDKKHIPTAIIENTNLYCQLKHKNEEKYSPKRKAFDAKSWIASLQNTIVQAPLVEQIA